MTAPERLRLELAARRADGLDFDDAWPAALRCALLKERDRRRWKRKLAETRDGWERAYLAEPQTPAERALERAFGVSAAVDTASEREKAAA